MILADSSLIYKGIRPLQKLGATARELAVNNPFVARDQRIPHRLAVVPPDPWAGDPQKGRDMIAGVFSFCGIVVEKENLSWTPEGVRPEWIAELHKFEWLRDLRSVGGDRARRMAREMAASWLAQHERPSDVAWHPETIGVRLASWISFHDLFCASADDEFRAQYFSSLDRQARYLMRALPGRLSGIALMRALKGLAYSGIAVEGAEERLESAFRMILQQIREQILPDGAHASRSPQATFEFLHILVDLRTALNAARLPVPDDLQHGIDRMVPAVKFFRHGDGALAQFNGGQEGNGNIIDATLMHSGAKGRAMKSLPHAGYEKIAMGRAAVIMDVGLHATVKHSERAHAGILSFEYSFGRERVFVNCGTAGTDGKWRHLLRSTAAHTALVVDNRNACQFDDKGQLAGRLEVKHKLCGDGTLAAIHGTHSGYLPRFGLMHQRFIRLQDSGETLAGEDTLVGRPDVPFVVRFHLHPSIQASVIAEGSEILLRSRSGIGWRFSSPGHRVDVEDSVYMSEGELPRRTLQIALSGITTDNSTTVAWELRREKI